jgi:hypothetical protein
MAELSIDQQFQLAAFELQVKQMSREQAQEFLINLFKQYQTQRAAYIELLGHQWGISYIP